MDKAKKDGKPFFVWHNTTRMHVFTFLSPKYQAMMNYKTNYGLEEAGMAQLDDSVGALLKHLDDIGEADNTIVIFTTDNGAEVFTWPDGGMTPFKATKGTVVRGRLPRAGDHPLAGQGQARHDRERHLLRPRLVPDARRRRRQSEHHRPAAEGRRRSAARTYKNHLDGYDQMDLLTGKGPSKRHELFYFGGPQLGALRIDDYQVPVLPAAVRLARREGHDRHAEHRQPPPGPVRAHAVDRAARTSTTWAAAT